MSPQYHHHVTHKLLNYVTEGDEAMRITVYSQDIDVNVCPQQKTKQQQQRHIDKMNEL